MTEAVADQGDLASYYDDRYRGAYMAEHAPLERRRVADTLAAIPRHATAVLDYGCGRGAWTGHLRAAFPGARLTGVDISATAIDSARADHPDGEWQTFDGARADFADASFDVVFSYHVLEHVLDLDATLDDMARLVRPGGHLCTILPCANRGSLGEWAMRQVPGGIERSATGEVRFHYEDPGHLRRLTTAELERRLEQRGLRLVDERYMRHLAVVDYFARQPWVVRGALDPSRARSAPVGLVLAALRATFLGLGAAMRPYSVGPRRLAALAQRGPDPRTRAVALGGLATMPAAMPVGALVGRLLPVLEWRYAARERRGAAAQFLVFRR